MRATQHGLTWSLPDTATHCTATALGPIVFSKFLLIWVMYMHVERGGSVVECRTRNRESPGSNPL